MSILYLIGFMGSGKSTVAKTLSLALNCKCVDVDAVIVEKTGMSINAIFTKHGEQYFRDLESEALNEIGPSGNLIVATGGGCIERKKNIELMQEKGTTIFLRADWDDIVNRISATDDRPLASDADGWSKTKALYQKRLPIYESADVIIDTVNKSPDDISREIITELDNPL